MTLNKIGISNVFLIALSHGAFIYQPKKAIRDYFLSYDGVNFEYLSLVYFNSENCLDNGGYPRYFRLTGLGTNYIKRKDKFTSSQIFNHTSDDWKYLPDGKEELTRVYYS